MAKEKAADFSFSLDPKIQRQTHSPLPVKDPQETVYRISKLSKKKGEKILKEAGIGLVSANDHQESIPCLKWNPDKGEVQQRGEYNSYLTEPLSDVLASSKLQVLDVAKRNRLLNVKLPTMTDASRMTSKP
uniref:Uncharacterized protein n=1 Tax=Globisporangium ultimum (strain ATCC 200006 / CBS 805.95 / DAOM BR144) TaxID=431595 RepID=K3X9D6_GLOUD